ncbi:proline-rich receptor-like protein kinase PERK9 [Dendronephthya gigantea]|uniref:proline-rich receptor-like protein kinase PERK9 n=1 Tax=Dendronephthya gigantea TaxID=151771 RepID=UPI0010698777|nr:proline-rich receptor-like protein kinase PERK9 [Dendronephthya gigantea]
MGSELGSGTRRSLLVRNLSERGGPGKLRPFWENNIHIVVKRRGSNSPVYEVESEKRDGKKGVLHRNLILPCDYLPADNHKDAPRRPTAPRQPRQPPPRITPDDDDETSSDEEYPDVATSSAPTETCSTPLPKKITPPDQGQLPPNEIVLNELTQEDPPPEAPVGEPPNPEENPAPDENPIPAEAVPLPENLRPQRTRQPPERLTYYNPGEPLGVFSIAAPSPQHPFPLNQLNPNIRPPVYHHPQHVPFHYPQLFPGSPFLPLQTSAFLNPIPPFPEHTPPMMMMPQPIY